MQAPEPSSARACSVADARPGTSGGAASTESAQQQNTSAHTLGTHRVRVSLQVFQVFALLCPAAGLRTVLVAGKASQVPCTACGARPDMHRSPIMHVCLSQRQTPSLAGRRGLSAGAESGRRVRGRARQLQLPQWCRHRGCDAGTPGCAPAGHARLQSGRPPVPGVLPKFDSSRVV